MATDARKLAAKQRAAHLREQKRILDEVGALYAAAERRLKPKLEAYRARLRNARAAGIEPSPAWAWQVARLQELLDDISREVGAFAAGARELTEREMLQALRVGLDDAKNLTAIAMREVFGGIQPGVLEVFSLFSDRTKALGRLFGGFGADASKAARETVFTGLAEGWSPRKTARELEGTLEISKRRAETIARTETMRARNTAHSEFYKANDDVVLKWRWSAALNMRTCAVCLAMDGKVFDVGEELHSHPNCRCTMIPITEISQPPDTTGREWLAARTPDEQRRILGRKGAELYRAGEVSIDDFVEQTVSAEWGPGRRQRSLRRMREMGLLPPEPPKVAAAPPAPPKPTPDIAENWVNSPELSRHEAAIRAYLGDDVYDVYQAKLDEFFDSDKVRVSRRERLDVLEQHFVGSQEMPPRFKSQHETGTSQGCLDPALRERAEKRLFGSFPSDKADAPIYGSVKTESYTGYYDGASYYGEVQCFLKRESWVRKATFTGDDSLGTNLIPSPMGRPSLASILGRSLSHWNNPPVQRALMEADVEEFFKKLNKASGYVEAQMHGRLSLADIEEVVFPDNRPPSPALRQLLESYGIRIVEADLRSGYP